MFEDSEFSQMFSGKAPVEANAEARAAASFLFEMYSGMVGAGFTVDQAMQIVIACIMKGAK